MNQKQLGSPEQFLQFTELEALYAVKNATDENIALFVGDALSHDYHNRRAVSEKLIRIAANCHMPDGKRYMPLLGAVKLSRFAELHESKEKNDFLEDSLLNALNKIHLREVAELLQAGCLFHKGHMKAMLKQKQDLKACLVLEAGVHVGKFTHAPRVQKIVKLAESNKCVRFLDLLKSKLIPEPPIASLYE